MKIVDSDAFLDMPLSTQALYFHLNMRADDDGFVGNPKKIMRLIGATDDDFKILVAKNFLLLFDNGVIVIKHWRMHNTLSSGRYHETTYLTEKEILLLKKNGAYSLTEGEKINDTRHIEMADRQIRRTKDEQKTNADLDLDIDKDIDKDNKRENIKEKGFIVPTLEEVTEYCRSRNNKVNAQKFIDFYESKGWYVGKNKMKDWKASVRTWENRDKNEVKPGDYRSTIKGYTDDLFEQLEKETREK